LIAEVDVAKASVSSNCTKWAGVHQRHVLTNQPRPCAILPPACLAAGRAICAAQVACCTCVAALAAVGVHGGAVADILAQGAALQIATELVVWLTGIAQALVGGIGGRAVGHLTPIALHKGLRGSSWRFNEAAVSTPTP